MGVFHSLLPLSQVHSRRDPGFFNLPLRLTCLKRAIAPRRGAAAVEGSSLSAQHRQRRCFIIPQERLERALLRWNPFSRRSRCWASIPGSSRLCSALHPPDEEGADAWQIPYRS